MAACSLGFSSLGSRIAGGGSSNWYKTFARGDPLVCGGQFGATRYTPSVRKGARCLCELGAIRLADLVDGAVHAQVAFLDPDRALADALDLVHGVAHEQDGDVAIVDEVLDAFLALLLEEHVADGEGLVHDEDVRLGDGGDGERDARDHAGGEVLHGHVHEVGQLGKLDDLLEVRVDELLGVTEECAVEVDVLAGGELRSSKI